MIKIRKVTPCGQTWICFNNILVPVDTGTAPSILQARCRGLGWHMACVAAAAAVAVAVAVPVATEALVGP